MFRKEKFLPDLEEVLEKFVNLYKVWQNEKKHESWEEHVKGESWEKYAQAIKDIFKGYKVINISEYPFGMSFEVDEKEIRLQVIKDKNGNDILNVDIE